MPLSTSPPRAVSRTATSTSERPRISCAPLGPVQSPGSIRRSSTSTPSDVVVPTWRPARSRIRVISRVVVDFPLVPEIEMMGIWRSALRIHGGGDVEARWIRSIQCIRRRSWDPVRWARRAGVAARSVSATEASAIRRARSAPTHGHVTIQCPGSDDRWARIPPTPSACPDRRRRAHPASVVTGSGQSRSGTLAPRRTSAWRAGTLCPNQVRRRPIASSTLTTGSSRYTLGPSKSRISITRIVPAG